MAHQQESSLTGKSAGRAGHVPVSASGALKSATSTRRKVTRSEMRRWAAAAEMRRTIGWRNMWAL
jgi:hypothetical protein